MATSALLVEIVVIGVLTLIALCFDLRNFSPDLAHELHECYINLHVGAATGAAIIFGIAYPLGWAVNSLSYIFTAAVFRATHNDFYSDLHLSWRNYTNNYTNIVRVVFVATNFFQDFTKEFKIRLTRVELTDDNSFIKLYSRLSLRRLVSR